MIGVVNQQEKKTMIYATCFFSLLGLALVGGCSSDSGVDSEGFEGDIAGECSDLADNDRDGLFDCDDPDCSGSV